MDLQGYAVIKQETTTGKSPLPLSEFEGKTVRILDINDRNDVMVVNAEATGIATFDACDVYKFFKIIESAKFV